MKAYASRRQLIQRHRRLDFPSRMNEAPQSWEAPRTAPRRVLVPFAGVGSEMIGALLAGWECVVGVEQEADYVQIAKERLAYWAARARQDKGALGVKRPPPVSAKQLQLFED